MLRKIVLLLALAVLFGCSTQQEQASQETEKQVTKTEEDAEMKNTKVLLTTNLGEIEIELFDKEAPVTVKNFVSYVKSGFYDGTVFHRVIPDFMAQGGGYTEDFGQKETNETIQNEANNGIKNERGTIAMARTNFPHSASSQFFINLVDNHFLDFVSETPQGWGYAVFGKVTKGMEVVDEMAKVPTGSAAFFRSDVPVTNIIIEKAVVVSKTKPKKK